jgi:hypothetical protein
MPRITPSTVVSYIDRAFGPGVAMGNLGTLDAGSLQPLSVLVVLCEAIDPRALAALDDTKYHDFVVALELVRVTTTRWHSPPTPGWGTQVVAPFVPLDNRHPVVVLRQILMTCPDEPTDAVELRLAFLADPELQTSIAADVTSAEAAVAEGRYKTACVMAGAAIEALLLWALQKRTDAERDAAFNTAQAERKARNVALLSNAGPDLRRWPLENYVEVSRQLGVVTATTADAAMLAKDFRNLIHPGRAERLQVRATRGAAAQAVAAMLLTIENFASP